MGKKRKRRQTNTQPALEWRESRTVRRQDELWVGDEVVATLRWEGMLSTMATGRARTGYWTFERPRILSREVEVRVAASGELVGVLSPRWTGDAPITLSDGRTFEWAPTNFWQSEWVLTDAHNQPLVRFWDISGFLRRRTAIEIVRSGLSEPDRALLVLLGHYMIEIQRRDTAAATAAIVPTVVG
jgi:hypothetical protein